MVEKKNSINSLKMRFGEWKIGKIDYIRVHKLVWNEISNFLKNVGLVYLMLGTEWSSIFDVGGQSEV